RPGRQRREHRAGAGDPDGCRALAAWIGNRTRTAAGQTQHRGGDGIVEAGEAVQVRGPRRHPLCGGDGRGRDRQGHGDGQGPAPGRSVRGGTGRVGQGVAGRTGPATHGGTAMKPVRLDGRSLTRAQLVAVAHGAQVELAEEQLPAVARAAEFLADQVRREEPIYGVSTGFGSNADRLLGAHRLRAELPGEPQPAGTLHEELQRNLIITHAVCVGEPFASDVVRAMLCIRINTLMRGHSGIRVQTLQALVAMLNAGIVPVVPQLGSVGASGDLAPLSHLAIVLLGGGEAFYQGERVSGAEALDRAGLQPVVLSYKEGLALNNGTAQMLACGVLALSKLEDLLDTADLAAAMTIDAFAGRLGAFAEEVHALRPHPGQVEVAAHLRRLLDGSTLADIPYHLVPAFKPWSPRSWDTPDAQALRFDIGWN